MKMNYCVVGTHDMDAATTFYDALFARDGMQGMAVSERMTYWVGSDFAFAVAIPFDGEPASVGNGMMVGFYVGKEVDRMHALAIEMGGACEGAPCQKGPKYSG
jgi:hypothetical protein